MLAQDGKHIIYVLIPTWMFPQKLFHNLLEHRGSPIMNYLMHINSPVAQDPVKEPMPDLAGFIKNNGFQETVGDIWFKWELEPSFGIFMNRISNIQPYQ
jgi:hypothetical protein